MIGRRTRIFLLTVAAALTAGPMAAQQRFRVLVPDFYAPEGTRRNFGRDTAEELRELLNTLVTHQPIDEDEIDDQLDELDLDMEDLDCLRTRQFATQINANIALCATYTESDDRQTREVTGIQFWDMTTGEPLNVDPITVTGEDGEEQAAQQIFGAFDRMVQLTRAQQFCAEYALSRQWDNALTNCVQALALNPAAMGTRLRKARIHFQQTRDEDSPPSEAERTQYLQQALEELDTVLESNPFHEDALQLAGFVAIQLGDEEAGREYYYRYLEVNPGADAIRLQIAYDMADAGDPVGSMELVSQGLEAAPDNPDLLTPYATYAYAAADRLVRESQGSSPPEAVSLYREVIDNLNKAAAILGADTPLQNRRTVMASHMQLGEAVQAERVAREVLATDPSDALVISILADAIHRQGRLDEAVEVVSRLRQVTPDAGAGNIEIRQANWLMGASRLSDALPFFRQAVQQGANPNEVARIVFGEAVNNGVRRENYAYAVTGLQAAKSFRVDTATRQEFDFWHGYTLYNQAIQIEDPQTLESAREALPVFEQARDLLDAGRAAAGRSGVSIQQLLDAVNQYIEIQQVIIRRYG